MAIAAGATFLFVLLDLSRNGPDAVATDRTVGSVVVFCAVLAVAAVIQSSRRTREAAAYRDHLVHLSVHDPLTDLPNRRLLRRWLAEDISRSQASNTQAGVLFIDLDRFKQVNDLYGHEAGDQLMRAVAERLRNLSGPDDRLARFGGDEFVLLSPGHTTSVGLERAAKRIIRGLEQPFVVGEQVMRISASIGAALAERRGVKPGDVLRDADVAMYQAKAGGSGQVMIFDRSMTGTLTPATAEEQIRDALEAGEFHLHYQPVVDLASGRIVGAEALLRWISPTRGTMAPAEFIPILEETGLILPVGTWVLQEACREAARLNEVFPDQAPLSITVNVSARQLTQIGFAETVARAIFESGVQDGQMHLEITEGALMHDVESAWVVLRQVKALGVKLALDDFGTGYSSLTYVRRFSLDMLKVDKTFIDGLDTSPEDRAIVEYVVSMADALGMVTVAEGAERPEQLAWLRRLGCRWAQGYALSRPLAAGHFEELLRRRAGQPFRIDAPSLEPIELVLADLAGDSDRAVVDRGVLRDVEAALTPPPVSDAEAPPSRESDRQEWPVPGGNHPSLQAMTAPPPSAVVRRRASRTGALPLPRLREYRRPGPRP